MKNNNKVASPNGNVGAADKVKPSVQSKSMASKKQYKGVRMRSWGSWVSEIRAPNQKTRIWLGSYSTPEAAARAYDAALLCLKGSSANFNFPIASSAHIPTTLMSPKSIQRVAAAAANATTPTSSPSPSTPSTSMSSSSSTSSSSLLPSSPSDYQDEIFASCTTEDPSHSIDPWTDFCDFLSPKYVDQMLCSCSFFAPPCLEECDEEVDIRLWSFC